MKESKEKAKTVFGGLFGKVSMYGDKEGVVVFSGDNPKCFFDVKVRYSTIVVLKHPMHRLHGGSYAFLLLRVFF